MNFLRFRSSIWPLRSLQLSCTLFELKELSWQVVTRIIVHVVNITSCNPRTNLLFIYSVRRGLPMLCSSTQTCFNSKQYIFPGGCLRLKLGESIHSVTRYASCLTICAYMRRRYFIYSLRREVVCLRPLFSTTAFGNQLDVVHALVHLVRPSLHRAFHES